MEVHILPLRIIDKISSKEYFLLLHKTTVPSIILGASIEINTTSSIYFESLDSTGLFHPINNQSSVTSLFIHSIINFFNPTFLEIFYHPKNEILFKNSSLNTNKKICLNLKKYWLNILNKYYRCSNNKIYKLYTFNQDIKEFPYNKIEDIIFFDDDPKRKAYKDSKTKLTIDELYDILLCRTDFVKGGILTLNCDCKNHSNISIDDINISSFIDMLENNTYTYDNFKNLLLNLNFNNRENSFRSLEKIKQELKIKSLNFKKFILYKEIKEEKENIIKIGVRKK